MSHSSQGSGVGPLCAVQGLGQDAGDGGLAHPPDAREEVGVGDAAQAMAFWMVLTTDDCPTTSSNFQGLYFRANIS